jgi:hypothetical protein
MRALITFLAAGLLYASAAAGQPEPAVPPAEQPPPPPPGGEVQPSLANEPATGQLEPAAPPTEQPPAEPPEGAATPATEAAAPQAPATEAAAPQAPTTEPSGDTFPEVGALAAEPAAGERPEEPRFRDANADRVILFSTAETHPKGTFYFSDHEVILLQAGYALSDRFQLTLSGVPPIVEDQPYFFDIAGKLNFFRHDVFRAAVIVAGIAVLVPDVDESVLLGGRPGLVGQLCFDKYCRNSFSGNVNTIVNNQSNEVLPVLLSGGFVLHASDLVKFLAEPMYALGVGENTEQPDGFLLGYGVRLSGSQFGFDLAFLKPIGMGDSPIILGLPWIAFTFRTEGDPRPAQGTPPVSQ